MPEDANPWLDDDNALPVHLRHGLGKHRTRSGALPAHGLTLHELGELIRRAGISAGFIVESEFKVPGLKRRRIDWAWLSPASSKPIAAFEVEGRNAAPQSVMHDVAKFRACGAPINVIALFQIDHDRVLKRDPPHRMAPRDWVQRHIGDFPADVLLDEDLMKAGGIENLQRRALAADSK